MALGRIIFTVPLFYQQLFYCPPPPEPPAEEVPAFSYVDVTTHRVSRRTLFYQAHITPPPTAELQQEVAATTPDKWLMRWQGPPRYWPIKQQAIPFVPREAVLENTVTPDKWLLSWKGPPKYQPNSGPFAAGPLEPPAPPAVVDNINAATGITTGGVRRRTLFYQSSVAPVGVPAAEVVVTTIEWAQPFSRAPSRTPTETGLYTPFVPSVAARPDVAWLQPFKRNVAGPFPVHTQPVLGYAAAPQVTPDEWQQPLSRAAPRPFVYAGLYTPFVPEEATVENTLGNIAWAQPFYKAAPIVRPVVTQPVYGYPYEAAVVVTDVTPAHWMPAWTGPPRLWPPRTWQPFIPTQAPAVTPDEWLPSWQGPPRRLLLKVNAQPFVPREATIDNTVDQGWRVPLSEPVSARPVWHTQPAYGFPYEGVDNSRFEWDWHIQWQGPPRYWPLGRPYQPFVPAEATRENTQTPDKWLVRWQGPPRGMLRLQPGQPFVAREAVVDNTVDQGWRTPLSEPVAARPVWWTQPFYGYPYEQQAIVVPYEQWWHQPLSRAAVTPPVRRQPYAPFVPREATRENTVAGGWWQPLRGTAVPPRPVWRTQPLYGFPYESEDNTRTGWDWFEPFYPLHPRKLPRPTQPGWHYEPVAPSVTPSILWFQPLSTAVPTPPAIHTQPFYGYPYEFFVPTTYQQSVTATITLTVNFHYCGWGTAAEQVELFGTASEQETAWTVVTEAVEGVSSVSEQTTTWSTEEEQEDDTEEQDPQCP